MRRWQGLRGRNEGDEGYIRTVVVVVFPRMRTRLEEVATVGILGRREPSKLGVIGKGGSSEGGRDKPKLLEVDSGFDPPGPDGVA